MHCERLPQRGCFGVFALQLMQRPLNDLLRVLLSVWSYMVLRLLSLRSIYVFSNITSSHVAR